MEGGYALIATDDPSARKAIVYVGGSGPAPMKVMMSSNWRIRLLSVPASGVAVARASRAAVMEGVNVFMVACLIA